MEGGSERKKGRERRGRREGRKEGRKEEKEEGRKSTFLFAMIACILLTRRPHKPPHTASDLSRDRCIEPTVRAIA